MSALHSIECSDPHFDQLMRCKGTLGLAYHRVGQSCVADVYDRLERMGASFERDTLSRGQRDRHQAIVALSRCRVAGC